MSQQDDLSLYLVPEKLPLVALECETAFNALTKQEKLYAHYLSAACWEGGQICLHQMSTESPAIFKLFLTVFHAKSVEALRSAALAAGVSEKDWQDFLNYAALFFGNFGNYLSFGDTKFIPRVPKSTFQKVILLAQSETLSAAALNELLGACIDKIYSCERNERSLAVDGAGTSGYYSPGITTEHIKLVQDFCQERGVSPLNTRLFVTSTSPLALELRLASVEVHEPVVHKHKDATITVTTGDYSDILAKVNKHLEQALKHAANDNQRAMVSKYIETFRTGDIEAFKDSQRAWIKDIGPVVELNMGFVETYRDPIGIRAEYDGWVAMVNKETSAKFAKLVQMAEKFLTSLPWGKDFEKDKFLKPDFTSLEVLAYAGCGIPSGINIPNFDDIRQNEGFKNVSLGNVLTANLAPDNEPVSFISSAEQALYQANAVHSFEVQVGLHELLGHGSGKLFRKEKDGSFNFDAERVVIPQHTIWEQGNKVAGGDRVKTYYAPNETYDSKFPVFSSSYEECRAEAVGLVLCLDPDVLEIFGYSRPAPSTVHEIAYVNWLVMARAGLRALEFYTPETNQWRQAHMQARFALLRVMLNAGEGLIRIDESEMASDKLTIHLDKDKILSVGLPAVRNFLLRLMIYKATADYDGARDMYSNITSTEPLLKYRDVVLKNKKPRKDFVQAHTFVDSNGDVAFKKFSATSEGMIESFVARF